jgi:hypothetical protein
MSSQNSERHDPYAALRFRDYRLLLTGRFLTTFGNEMLSFAIGWELWLRTHSAFALGIVGFLSSYCHSLRGTSPINTTADGLW